ncbi:hypothetical protein [Streptomyces sp. CC224B]|uniref:hypothetical protein n=1 Tax=Streptomyces sp. CC224B TaxID=3044571 RepID=UPI0024A7FDA3|nr:hypothetical protein [Streptomyces sp. CC224B]
MTDSMRPVERQQVVAGDLGRYLREALPGDPGIDAVGCAGGTVADQLRRCLEHGDLTGRPHVRLRVVVPDFTQPLDGPRGVNGEGGAEDDEVLRRELLREAVGLAHEMAALDRRLHSGRRARLDVEFRVLHLTPVVTFCLIDRSQLFDAARDRGEGKAAPRLSPAAGRDAVLTRWHVDAGAAARERIRARGLLFDALWSVARPLTRTG